MSAPLRFGVSEFTTMPWSFEQDVENYARLGVTDLEVCEVKLSAGRAEEQLALAGERGLTISSVQPAVRTLFPSRMQPDPEDLGERTARFRRAIERISPFAPEAAFVSNTGPPPGGDIRKVCEVAAGEYRELANFAREHGARVALEPLSAALMNVETAIWTLAQAREIVESVDHECFGVCLDLWNVFQNPNVLEEIKALGERVFVAQVSDWKTPRSYADRHVVGRGDIPLRDLLRAIHQSGYRGPYTLEIFSQDVPDSLWDADLFRVIEESRANLQNAYSEALAPDGPSG